LMVCMKFSGRIMVFPFIVFIESVELFSTCIQKFEFPVIG